jgi:hypothetical protein
MTVHSIIANALRRLDTMFPGYFATTTKRNHYIDFGYPESVTFEQLWQMYTRNGIARAAVSKTILKTWQDHPILQTDDKPDELNPVEQEVQDKFADLRFWQKLATADRRSLVGAYSGVIFRFADNKRMREPVVGNLPGLDALVEIIPAWAGQLKVAEWDTDEMSEDYGKPKMFQFNETAVDAKQGQTRSFEVHPDRVVVWSEDGTVYGESALLAGYNDLVTIEKVMGAGGEGFWKNAKSAPVLQLDKDAKVADMAKAMGVAPDKIADAMNDQVEDYQKGFDALLMLQGMEAKTLGVTLPQPKEFVEGPLQSFAASWGIPIKILVGMQTGERASKEDADEWSQTNMARRNNSVIPNIMAVVDRLKGFGILKDLEWSLYWPDLTEASMAEKIDRADKMAGINQKQAQAGSMEVVFTEDEIRETVGFDPLSGADRLIDDTGDDEKAAAANAPRPPEN